MYRCNLDDEGKLRARLVDRTVWKRQAAIIALRKLALAYLRVACIIQAKLNRRGEGEKEEEKERRIKSPTFLCTFMYAKV
jgi:hypothetical protein